MKENMLDVLMYLFQSDIDQDIDANPDRESIQTELLAAGFPSQEVRQAFDWLDSLVDRQSISLPVNPGSCRIYIQAEQARLDADCRGFLLSLEQSGILDSETRELVIDRVMALETEDIDLHQLKWIILMVLLNQPGQEEAYAWMEELIFDEVPGYLH
jgi:Smg protein